MELAAAIITLLVGITVFIVGMNMMSSGLKKATGKSVRKLFKKTQNSSIVGLGIGVVITALIQSSAATSVMTIGFINAGVMTIFQGVSIMMGAYIGTTATGILVSLSSFNISIFLIAFAVIGLVLMFFKNKKVKYIGEVLCGLGLIFFGLETMSGAFKVNGSGLIDAFQEMFENVSFPLLLLLIGILLTIIMQSSSAVTGVVLVMVGSGAMPFASALYVTLGATIGTCVTTLIATIGTNVNAKRAGIAALFIKIIAGLSGLVILWIFEDQLVNIFQYSFGSNEMGVALFLVFFNVIFMFALLPLIKPLEKLVSFIIKDKDAEKKKQQLLYIDNLLLNQPNIALMQTKKEIIHMYILAKENFSNAYAFFIGDSTINTNDIIEKEDTIDYINNALAEYLVKLSASIDSDNAETLGSYFHVINDIERIGDHAYNFYEKRLDMIDKDLEFSNQAKEELNSFYKVVMKMFELTLEIFNEEEKYRLEELHKLEDETDDLNRTYASNHYARMQKGQCNNELSPYYSTILSELERVGDHLTNIGYSIVNPVGDEQ